MEKLKAFLFRVDEDIFRETNKESKATGISINTIFNLKLKGLKLKIEKWTIKTNNQKEA